MSYEKIINDIINLDKDTVSKLNDEFDVKVNIVEPQRVFIWTRIYLKDELEDILEGDQIELHYIPTDEKLVTTFSTWERMGQNKDKIGYFVSNVSELDKKILILLIDESHLTEEVPFIRTLFRDSRYYEYQLMKKSELIVTNKRTNHKIDYIDISF